jgi:hypothetical protein
MSPLAKLFPTLITDNSKSNVDHWWLLAVSPGVCGNGALRKDIRAQSVPPLGTAKAKQPETDTPPK